MDPNHNSDVLKAGNIRRELAEGGLPPPFAKLYSQHTLLRAGRPGLGGWRENEATRRLEDAMRLTAAALLEKDEGIDGWYNGLRRAGELLEWLAHSQLNTLSIPTEMLASAAYQLAGYPARAAGLLADTQIGNQQSAILLDLLRANFRSLFLGIASYWSVRLTQDEQFTNPFNWDDESLINGQMQVWTTDETIRALGTLCAELRWGDDSRLAIAIGKLRAISRLMIHSKDPFSWITSRLCAEVVSAYVQTSLRTTIADLFESINDEGKQSVERYLRASYMASKAVAWPSQIRGITRLIHQDSFALCTPTGSGKTVIAELAIISSLFADSHVQDGADITVSIQEPMAIYLVPSKALAAETEAKLSTILSQIGNRAVRVTSLYGGTDWGPTDAWFTSDERVILICTYEKAEALIRFLGTTFLDRVAIVVIDEAHSVQFDGDFNSLIQAENRPLRLELLGTRLMALLENKNCRFVALSAVTRGIEGSLAGWVSGNKDSSPVESSYRSTRQMIGRLHCLPGGRSEIRYDLLDGASLQFEDEGRQDTPFVPNPFPRFPEIPGLIAQSAGLRVRPYLLWAAIHIAGSDSNGKRQSVLISVASGIGGYAKDFLRLLDRTWREIELPNFFEPPIDSEKADIWSKCLSSCADYFTQESREYRLLEKGIIMHHGKMPGALARLFIEAIQQRIVNIVVATSTLTQGVNLPFETVLIPKLRRWRGGWNAIDSREFGNLVGRAGRPGYGTEGQSLVVIPFTYTGDKYENQVRLIRADYARLIHAFLSGTNVQQAQESSPLAALLGVLEKEWQKLSGSRSTEGFYIWLEQTAPLELDDDSTALVNALDMVDSVLLSVIVEIEQISQVEIPLDELEENLKRVWRRSYSFYASADEDLLGNIFVHRAKSLVRNIYPARILRRRLYRTNLPPREGNKLFQLQAALIAYLEEGSDYSIWDSEKKLDYLQSLVQKLGAIQRFEPKDIVHGKSRVRWQDVLAWWVAPTMATHTPTRTQISKWHSRVSSTFQYRFNWGLGCFISLQMEDKLENQENPLSLEDWPLTGLPWIVFWIKELITWGTLDPVAAFLLSRRLETTRNEAETAAENYYETQSSPDPNELLNALTIRNWTESRYNLTAPFDRIGPPEEVGVELLRDFSAARQRYWRVIPIQNDDALKWLDPAGYVLASSGLVGNWRDNFLELYDFELDVERLVVSSRIYL